MRVKSAQNPVLHDFLVRYCPLFFLLFFYPGHFTLTIKAIDLKLQRTIDIIEKTRSAQELVLCHSLF
jgi:hypothetical protein